MAVNHLFISPNIAKTLQTEAPLTYKLLFNGSRLWCITKLALNAFALFVPLAVTILIDLIRKLSLTITPPIQEKAPTETSKEIDWSQLGFLGTCIQAVKLRGGQVRKFYIENPILCKGIAGVGLFALVKSQGVLGTLSMGMNATTYLVGKAISVLSFFAGGSQASSGYTDSYQMLNIFNPFSESFLPTRLKGFFLDFGVPIYAIYEPFHGVISAFLFSISLLGFARQKGNLKMLADMVNTLKLPTYDLIQGTGFVQDVSDMPQWGKVSLLLGAGALARYSQGASIYSLGLLAIVGVGTAIKGIKGESLSTMGNLSVLSGVAATESFITDGINPFGVGAAFASMLSGGLAVKEQEYSMLPVGIRCSIENFGKNFNSAISQNPGVHLYFLPPALSIVGTYLNWSGIATLSAIKALTVFVRSTSNNESWEDLEKRYLRSLSSIGEFFYPKVVQNISKELENLYTDRGLSIPEIEKQRISIAAYNYRGGAIEKYTKILHEELSIQIQIKYAEAVKEANIGIDILTTFFSYVNNVSGMLANHMKNNLGQEIKDLVDEVLCVSTVVKYKEWLDGVTEGRLTDKMIQEEIQKEKEREERAERRRQND